MSQLAVELLKVRANINMIHVPYAGASQSLQAAASGTTSPELPDVPTMQEAGIPNAVVETWQMLLAPAKMPEPIIKRLTEATRAVMDEPDVRARLEKVGLGAMKRCAPFCATGRASFRGRVAPHKLRE